MAFPSIAHDPAVGVTVGVDTHGEIHVAAAFTSDLGRPLGHLEVPTTPTGYGRLDPLRHAIRAAVHRAMELDDHTLGVERAEDLPGSRSIHPWT